MEVLIGICLVLLSISGLCLWGAVRNLRKLIEEHDAGWRPAVKALLTKTAELDGKLEDGLRSVGEEAADDLAEVKKNLRREAKAARVALVERIEALEARWGKNKFGYEFENLKAFEQSLKSFIAQNQKLLETRLKKRFDAEDDWSAKITEAMNSLVNVIQRVDALEAKDRKLEGRDRDALEQVRKLDEKLDLKFNGYGQRLLEAELELRDHDACLDYLLERDEEEDEEDAPTVELVYPVHPKPYKKAPETTDDS